MAVIHGKTGDVAGGALDAKLGASPITNWTVDGTCDVADATGMIDAPGPWPKTYKAGFVDWTASFDIVIDDAVPAPSFYMVGTEESVVFHLNGAHDLTGNCIITGQSVTVDKDDVVKSTISAQGSGTLVYT